MFTVLRELLCFPILLKVPCDCLFLVKITCSILARYENCSRTSHARNEKRMQRYNENLNWIILLRIFLWLFCLYNRKFDRFGSNLIKSRRNFILYIKRFVYIELSILYGRALHAKTYRLFFECRGLTHNGLKIWFLIWLLLVYKWWVFEKICIFVKTI